MNTRRLTAAMAASIGIFSLLAPAGDWELASYQGSVPGRGLHLQRPANHLSPIIHDAKAETRLTAGSYFEAAPIIANGQHAAALDHGQADGDGPGAPVFDGVRHRLLSQAKQMLGRF